MRHIVVALVFLCVVSATGMAQAHKIPGLDCKAQTVAIYMPGPEWRRSGEFVSGHLNFLRSQLQKGTLTAGGPFSGTDGGMVVVNSDDLKQVDALLQQDPFIMNHVTAYSLQQWNECHAQSSPPPTK